MGASGKRPGSISSLPIPRAAAARPEEAAPSSTRLARASGDIDADRDLSLMTCTDRPSATVSAADARRDGGQQRSPALPSLFQPTNDTSMRASAAGLSATAARSTRHAPNGTFTPRMGAPERGVVVLQRRRNSRGPVRQRLPSGPRLHRIGPR